MAFEQFPYSNFHDLNLDWILQKVKEAMQGYADLSTKVDGFEVTLQGALDYINNYFKNLDVQDEIDKKLQEMADSGELANIVAQFIKAPFVYLNYNAAVSDKLAANSFFIIRRYANNNYSSSGSIFFVGTSSSTTTIPYNNLFAECISPVLTPETLGASPNGSTPADDIIKLCIEYSVKGYTIIVDGTYNLSTSYIVNDNFIIKNPTYTNSKNRLIQYKKLNISFSGSQTMLIGDQYNSGIKSDGSFQGACYNSKTDRIVMAQTYSDNSATLFEWAPDMSRVLAAHPNLELYHANDLCYDPVGDCYFVAPLEEAAGYSTILKVNSTFTTVTPVVISKISDTVNQTVSNISYDSINDLFYIRCGWDLLVLDRQWNIVYRNRHINIYNDGSTPTFLNPLNSKNAMQGSECINGTYIQSAYCESGNSNPRWQALLASINPITGNIMDTWQFNESNHLEVESLVFTGSYFYVFSHYGQYIGFQRLQITDNSDLRPTPITDVQNIYVNESAGSSAGDGLSSTTPMLSLQDAINTYGNQPCNIYLMSNISQNITINYITSSLFIQSLTSNTLYTISGTVKINNSYGIYFANCIITASVTASRSIVNYGSGVTFSGVSGSASNNTDGSLVYFNSTTFNNCTSAVRASTSALCRCWSCSGSGNTNGYYAQYGGIIFSANNAMSATTLFNHTNGSTIIANNAFVE